jgi:hypothetical protein
MCTQIPEVPKTLIFYVIQHLRAKIRESRKRPFSLPFSACVPESQNPAAAPAVRKADIFYVIQRLRAVIPELSKPVIFYVVQRLRT